MTYNVFGGTLNLAQSNQSVLSDSLQTLVEAFQGFSHWHCCCSTCMEQSTRSPNSIGPVNLKLETFPTYEKQCHFTSWKVFELVKITGFW